MDFDWRDDVMDLHDEARKYQRQAVLTLREADIMRAGGRPGHEKREQLLRERAEQLLEHSAECRRRGDALHALHKNDRWH